MLFYKNAQKDIRIQLIGCDYAPADLEAHLPIVCNLLRMLPGKDRPDYWLAKCENPVKYENANVNYLVVTPRFVGQKIKKGMGTIALGVAYVTDESLIHDDTLSFEKCKYVAICIAKEL